MAPAQNDVRLPHRAGLTERISDLRPDPSLYQRIGGHEVIEQVIETLYEHLMKDPLLTPIFRKSFDRAHSKAFFTEWMGGPTRYSDNPAHMRGVWRAHNRFFISKPMAGRWVYYMKNALIQTGVAPALRKEILNRLGPLARAMANGDRTRPENTQLQFGDGAIQTLDYWAVEELRAAVARGERQRVMDAVSEEPDHAVRRGLDGRTLLWQAAHEGDLELVRFLLERAAPIDTPGCLTMCTDFVQLTGPGGFTTEHVDPMVPVTPLAIALARGHHDVADALQMQGAQQDVYTAAYVGDIDRLRGFLDQERSLVHAQDPGDDFFRVTPLHHAVTGGQREAAALLIERGAEVADHSMWLLTFAALRRDLDLLELLLTSGADGSRALVLGPLDTPERPMADLLVAHGARLDDHPAHGSLLIHVLRGPAAGRRERVTALLSYGADANATGLFAIGALRLAVRERDPSMVSALLAAGARFDAVDDHGETPLFGLQKARAKGAAVPILQLLSDAGASLTALNRWGESILFPLVRQGEKEAVQWLLDRGLDRAQVNQRGKSVRDVAETSRKARAAGIVELL